MGNLYLRTQTTQNATQTLESYQYFDGLGRTTISSQTEASGSIFAETQYDALGRVSQVSNPYRAADTKRWTVTQYDALSRVLTVTKPGGAVTTSAYAGNSVTITDPATKSRKTVSDALGRVTSVIEDPGTSPHLNYQTNYTYDALDNLRKVVQGSQTRYFGYDSLKRLIRVKNPEQDVNSSLPAFTDPVTSNSQWAIAFTYDINSNLATKTDPRTITCTNTYDAMNRVLTRTYSNDPTQTPSIGYKYDGAGITAQNALGKLTSVATSGSFVSSYTYDNFDAMYPTRLIYVHAHLRNAFDQRRRNLPNRPKLKEQIHWTGTREMRSGSASPLGGVGARGEPTGARGGGVVSAASARKISGRTITRIMLSCSASATAF